MYITQNYVKIAVERLGGPTKVSHACSVSNATVHNWLKNQRIPDIAKAKIIAKAAGMEVQMLRGTR